MACDYLTFTAESVTVACRAASKCGGVEMLPHTEKNKKQNKTKKNRSIWISKQRHNGYNSRFVNLSACRRAVRPVKPAQTARVALQKPPAWVTRLALYIDTSRGPLLHCSALFKLSRGCSLSQCQWKSCFAAHNTSRAATVIAGARYSISSSCSLWCWAFFFSPPLGEFVAPQSLRSLFVRGF